MTVPSSKSYHSNGNGIGTGLDGFDDETDFRPLRNRGSIVKSYIESSGSDISDEDDSDSIANTRNRRNRLSGKAGSKNKDSSDSDTSGNGSESLTTAASFPIRLKIGTKAAKLIEMRNLRSRRQIDDDDDDGVEENHSGNGYINDEDEDGDISLSRSRSKKKDYNEDKDDEDEEEDVDEDEEDDESEKNKDDDDYEDAIIPRRRHSRKSINSSSATASKSTKSTSRSNNRSRRGNIDDDEDEYHELEEDDEENDSDEDNSGSDSEDSFEKSRKRNQDRGFIVSDDDESESYKRKKRRQKMAKRAKKVAASRSSRSRSRRRRVDDDDDEESEYESDNGQPEAEEDEIANLQEELRELRESATPPPEPVRKLQLRERKEVNYQILPPPLPDESFETVAVSPGRNTRRRGAGTGPIRRLFPTTGPFGGNDVVSVFGSGPGGIGAAAGAGGLGNFPGLPNVLGALGGPGGSGTGGGPNDPTALIDSDSSDDELIGAGGAGTAGAAGGAGKSKNNATGVSQFGIVKPKKPGLADADPLGIDTDIDFSAVGGLDNYIDQLKEMVTLPLRYPEIYQRFGITPPRGVLFHGPPGTGKTLMARALAASSAKEGKKITFFMRKGADCLSKWVGEAERQLRLLFEEARNQQPSIIFFDEIDGLAPVRSSKQEQIHASIVSTLLALMDGMDNRGQVIVIGATNRPDSVDPALRRPGRFDREFYFPLPDLEARKKIISINTKKWDPPLKPEFIDHVAGLTKGYGGADLRALCTEAALNAIQRKYPQIFMSNEKLLLDPQSIHVTPVDFMKSVDKIIPSSARSTSSGASPLPTRIEPLLGEPLKSIIHKLDNLLPRTKKLTPLEDALYEEIPDPDGGFARQEALKSKYFPLSYCLRRLGLRPRPRCSSCFARVGLRESDSLIGLLTV
ncbi:Yta7p [Sugiyamaella lignohabitans]|uniref:Yta7p n=1 Tax=Sugiyamaella lignohabitans TaxID=796027 RepID=A0A167F5D7_9ASCO|nr:Yta7p [Sugiyamaella lignohabitans]ANB14848.1 Yta7p [Sugiyamaella lignohabitans]